MHGFSNHSVNVGGLAMQAKSAQLGEIQDECRQSHVSESFSSLQLSITQLEDALSLLSGRIEPVLSPMMPPPSEKLGNAPEPVRAPLACGINAQAMRVSHCAIALQNILQRLEL